MLTFLLLAAAGFIAGGMNAVAGGGSFVALPALLGAGLPSTIANATTSVALGPAGFAGAWANRRHFVQVGPLALKPMMAISAAGGVTGAALLLATPARVFDQVLPWLLLLATLTMAYGPRLRARLATRDIHLSARVGYGLQFLIGIYGGYYGGAVGLIMLAVWTLISEVDLKTHAPARLLIGSTMNLAVVAYFSFTGMVAWAQCLPMFAGAMLGGYLGARLGRRLPGKVVRVVVLGMTAAITAAFFWRAYA